MTLPITDFIIERLLEFDPNYDVGAGTPTTGLLVEPLAVVFQPVIDEISVIQATQSILTILESSDPDAFPEDIVDELASNVLVDRDPGQIGSTVQRLRFFEPQAFSAQKGVLTFRGPSGQRYTNSEAVAVTRAEMSLNQDGSLYYTDFPIIALEEGGAFNVDAGTITTMEAEPAGVANTTNLFKVDQGKDRETNTELIDRMKVAVTVRALVTGRGIIVTLTEQFTSIREVQPIGMGQPEMMRDIVYNVHIGGNVDVYLRASDFTESSKDFVALEIDTSRQTAGYSSLHVPDADTPVSLSHSSLDRTSVEPVVKSIDTSPIIFAEGIDYTLDDVAGEITRLSSGTIYHAEGSGGEAGEKTLTLAGFFADTRPGMIITVTGPTALEGTYAVKTVTSVDEVEIYGHFPDDASFPVTGVDFAIDESLVVSYEYNPVAVDIIATPRADRSAYTITDVPVMLVTLVEVLDPLSGEPTGDTLSGDGGYGVGGYGAGGYGVGAMPDYRMVVTKPTHRFSSKEDNYLEFRQSQVGLSVRVHYLYASSIAAIQAYVDDRNNGTEAASLLVRQFIPAFVTSQADIEYDLPASAESTAPTEEEVLEAFTDFIDNVDGDDPLELSDLIDLLYDQGAEEVDLDGLQQLQAAIHHHDGSVEFVTPSAQGIMSIPDEEIPDPTDKPLSRRIARFVSRSVSLKRNVV